MTKTSRLLTCRQVDSIKLECKINLDLLFDTSKERQRFEQRWDEFLESDPHNPNIFNKNGNRLYYQSEQLIPKKQDNRPPLLLILGNPASQSIASGMFFSFEGNGTEHRFWKDILKGSGILKLSYDKNQPFEKLNKIRKKQLLDLAYESPFNIGLCVFITFPSAPGWPWGGVAGLSEAHRRQGASQAGTGGKHQGLKAGRRIHQPERRGYRFSEKCLEQFAI